MQAIDLWAGYAVGHPWAQVEKSGSPAEPGGAVVTTGTRQMMVAQHSSGVGPTAENLTFWERVNVTTRWGRYLTSVERSAVLRAASMADAPGTSLEVGCDGGRWSSLLASKGSVLTFVVTPSAFAS